VRCGVHTICLAEMRLARCFMRENSDLRSQDLPAHHGEPAAGRSVPLRLCTGENEPFLKRASTEAGSGRMVFVDPS
jgi:hypothetical protein